MGKIDEMQEEIDKRMEKIKNEIVNLKNNNALLFSKTLSRFKESCKINNLEYKIIVKDKNKKIIASIKSLGYDP